LEIKNTTIVASSVIDKENRKTDCGSANWGRPLLCSGNTDRQFGRSPPQVSAIGILRGFLSLSRRFRESATIGAWLLPPESY